MGPGLCRQRPGGRTEVRRLLAAGWGDEGEAGPRPPEEAARTTQVPNPDFRIHRGREGSGHGWAGRPWSGRLKTARVPGVKVSLVHSPAKATRSCVPPVKGTENQADGSGESEGFLGARHMRGPWVKPRLGRSCPQQTKHHGR